MREDQKLISDIELDRLLAQASMPKIPTAFQKQMLARINLKQSANVITLPQRRRTSGWLVGLPLAASLALGLWLGASGTTFNILPVNSSEVASTDIGNATGFDDLVFIIEGEKS